MLDLLIRGGTVVDGSGPGGRSTTRCLGNFEPLAKLRQQVERDAGEVLAVATDLGHPRHWGLSRRERRR